MLILHISYKDHVTNEKVRAKIQQAIGPHEDLTDDRKETQTAVVWSCRPFHQVWPKPSCKAQWKGEEDKADRGRGGKTTSGNGQAWSSASPRGQWRTEKMEKTGCKIICGAPTNLAAKGLMMMMMMMMNRRKSALMHSRLVFPVLHKSTQTAHGNSLFRQEQSAGFFNDCFTVCCSSYVILASWIISSLHHGLVNLLIATSCSAIWVVECS